MSEFISAKEVAKLLRVDETTVRRWMKRGAIDGEMRPAGERQFYRVKREAVEKLLGGAVQ